MGPTQGYSESPHSGEEESKAPWGMIRGHNPARPQHVALPWGRHSGHVHRPAMKTALPRWAAGSSRSGGALHPSQPWRSPQAGDTSWLLLLALGLPICNPGIPGICSFTVTPPSSQTRTERPQHTAAPGVELWT